MTRVNCRYKRRYNPTLIFNIFFNELNVTFSRQCDRLLSWKTNTDAQHNETAQLTVLAAECDQRELIMEVINKVPVARRIRRIKGGKLQVGLSVWQNRIIIFRRKKPRIAGFLLKLVGERGFEPPTHWSQTSCATKLRYSPISCCLLYMVSRPMSM